MDIMTVDTSLLLLLTSIALASSPEVRAFDDLVDKVTKEDCMNGLEIWDISHHCCTPIYFAEAVNKPHSDSRKCLRQSTKRKDEAFDPDELYNQYWRLTSCFYKKKKYFGHQQSFNMTQIRLDAAATKDPFQEKFDVEMYENCERKANESMAQFQESHKSVWENKPYRSRRFFFISAFYCVNHYAQNVTCPYFHWVPIEEAGISVCRRYANHCREIMKQ